MEPINQKSILRKMTPSERLKAALELYDFAWKMKEAGLRALHPDWDPAKIRRELRKIFLHART
jgi:hypothetical protein